MPTLAPGQKKITQRSAEEASAAQNANAGTKGVREGSNPNADIVERLVTTNFDPNQGRNETDQQFRDRTNRQNAGIKLADASLYVEAPGSNPAKVSTPAAPAKGNVIDESAINRLMKAEGLTREQAQQRITNLRPQVAQVASNTGLGGSFDAAGNFIPSGGAQTSAERIAGDNLRNRLKELSTPLRPDQVGPVYDSRGNITKSADAVRAELEASRAKEATEIQRQLTEQQERNRAAQEAAAAAGASGKPGEAVTPPTQDLETPAVPGMPDEAGNQRAIANALLEKEARLANANAAMPGEVNQADAEEEARVALAAKIDAADAVEKLQKEKALEKERNALEINNQQQNLAQIENTKAQLDQMNLNVDNEVKNRRSINKLSGGHDFGGLNWVRKQTQAGLDTLNYLRDKAANMSVMFGNQAISIINQYGLDLKQAEVDKKKTYAEDYEKYTTKLEDIRKELKDDNSKKRELRDKAHKDYSDVLTQADFKYGDYLNAIGLKAQDRVWAIEDREIRSKETAFSQGVTYMNMLTDKRIKSSPQALKLAEKMMGLPKGSLSIIASGTGNGSGTVPGYTAAQVQEANLAYFKQFNRLPSKDEIPTMVATYFHGRVLQQAAMSTEQGDQPDVWSNPFEEMRMMQDLGNSFAEWEAAVAEGSYRGTFLQWKKDFKTSLFSIRGSLSMDDGGGSSGNSSSRSIPPGGTGFGG